MRVHGFYGYIRANHARSIALFAIFVALVELLAGAMLAASVARRVVSEEARQQGLAHVFGVMADMATPALLIFPLTGCLIWIAVAWMFYRPVLMRSIGAKALARSADPALYDVVETQAIALGLPTPKIYLVETQAMNAFAAGLTRRGAMLGLTRGLVSRLSREEIEAVVAHELIHIRNGDARVIGLATICAGVVHRMAWLVVWHNLKPGLRMLLLLALGAMFVWEALALVAWAGVAAIGVALMTRIAIVRARDLVADASAAERTKNPNALASALRKIADDDAIGAVDVAAQAMMFSWSAPSLFSTHLPAHTRIAALERLAPGMIAPAALADSRGARPGASATKTIDARGLLARLGDLRAPEWVSHPYILGPAVVANLALFLALDASVGFRRIDLTPTATGASRAGVFRLIERQLDSALDRAPSPANASTK